MGSTIELLAPAGSPDAGYAALAYGADAVYLGLNDFSARAGADNFSIDDLRPFVNYAKQLDRPRNVYVTLNTLVQSFEIPKVLHSLAMLEEIGVDAVIVQDLGVLRLVREYFPALTIHASTQMAVHNREGVENAKRLGITRVILARELTLAEISSASAVPGIQTEVFAHGALCYSYSGLCLLSSHLRGKSGNKGRCCYLCRERFSRDQCGMAQPMSMKDLALAERVPELRTAGVACIKIEGRKKSPLYVAAATHYFRQALDGQASEMERAKLASDMNTIFAREQTTLYMDGRKPTGVITESAHSHHGTPIGTVSSCRRSDNGMERIRFTLQNRALEKYDGVQVCSPDNHLVFGFCAENFWLVDGKGRGLVQAQPGDTIEVELPREHPRIPIGATVACISSMAVKRSYHWKKPRPEPLTPTIPSSVHVTVAAQSVAGAFTFSAHGRELTVSKTVHSDAPFETAKTDPTDRFTSAVSKLGGTVFRLVEIKVDNPERLFVPTSMVNALRRELVDAASSALADARHSRTQAISHTRNEASPATEDIWSIKVDDVHYLDEFSQDDLDSLAEVVVSCSDLGDFEGLAMLAERMGGFDRLRLALPVIMREWERSYVMDHVQKGAELGVEKWEISNGWARELLLRLGSRLDIRADWPLYSMNAYAIDELLDWGVTGITASPEDTSENLAKLFDAYPNLCCTVYQDTPLAISEACLHAGKIGCTECGDRRRRQEMELSSDRDDLVAITRNCRTVVVGSQPLSLSQKLERLRQMGGKRFRADFIWKPYTAATVIDRFRTVKAGAFTEGHTGNFDRSRF